MGPWLVLVSPCFRGNVVATCKIGSFLCSLDNLLQKNVIVFFFGNQISKWRSFENWAIFDLLFTFFSRQGKVTKNRSAHISLTYIHVFCSPYWLFCLTNFEKKIRIYQVRFLFGMSPGVDSYSRHFGTSSINDKMVSKILVGMSTTDAKFIVICKPRTLNDEGEDSVKYRNRKKHRFLAAAILLFISKIIITW